MEIIERIDHWGRMTPDHAAYISGGRTLTYGELCRRSDALAARLAASLPEKSPVVVLGHKEPELPIFEGRMDNQIKLHGPRIELADVEANPRALPGVRDAVVLPVIKQGAVDSLAAFVILNERPARSDFQVASELKVQLTECLPAYMIPRKFSFPETFLMNINGKADRGKLAEALT